MTNTPGSGERRARRGFNYQDRASAVLAYQTILDGTMTFIALADDEAGMFDDFVRYAERNGVAPDRRQIRQSERLLRALLRAYIGRNTPLEETGFYANYYVVDAPVLKALEVFGEPHRE